MSTEIPSDPRGVLELALKNEQVSYDIYKEAGEKASTDLARHTFQFLCGEEERHMKAINEYFRALDEGRKPAELGQEHGLDYAKGKLKSVFERFRGDVRAAAEAQEVHLEAYKVGMEIESTGYEFYKQAAAQADSEFARSFYTWLMNEENAHYRLLADTHDFLQRPDGFLQEMERWMQT